MTRRPSILSRLETGTPAPTAAPAEAPTEQRGHKTKAGRLGVHKSSVYLPDAVYDRLREIAFHERKKVHDLFAEGINRVIEERGHPERIQTGTPSEG